MLWLSCCDGSCVGAAMLLYGTRWGMGGGYTFLSTKGLICGRGALFALCLDLHSVRILVSILANQSFIVGCLRNGPPLVLLW